MEKMLGIILCALLLFSAIPLTITGEDQKAEPQQKPISFTNDILYDTSPRDPLLLDRTSQAPGYYDTSEYLLGSVAVGIILLESDGLIDPNLENWTVTQITKVHSEINESFAWWSSQNQDAHLSYVSELHICPTSYEPIIHPSACTDSSWQEKWVSQAMADLGYTSGDSFRRTRDYINDIRTTYGTDWAFAVYIANSDKDADGLFSDGYCAYAYLGGPFHVMTYDNPPYGIEDMMQVIRHESSHLFYATDEYNGVTEYSGYLNQHDQEGADCIMYFPGTNKACTQTLLQLGWRDTDQDDIFDILDTNPETTLNDPTGSQTLTYTGTAHDVAYPNQNPGGPHNDVTINDIFMVYYRIDNGTYLQATPSDGSWDTWQEDYTFKVTLSPGPHTITVSAMNSVGNIDPTPANDTVVIGTPPNPPTITGQSSGKPWVKYTYNLTESTPGDEYRFLVDWGDGTNTTWLGPVHQHLAVDHVWTKKGTYTVKAKTKNTTGIESDWGTLQVTMPLRLSEYQEYIFLQHHPFLRLLLETLVMRHNHR